MSLRAEWKALLHPMVCGCLCSQSSFSLHLASPAVACGVYGAAAEASLRHSLLIGQHQELGHRPVCSGHPAEGSEGRAVYGNGACWARSGCLLPEHHPDQWRWLLLSPLGQRDVHETLSKSTVDFNSCEQPFFPTLAASITSNSTISPSPTLRRNFLGLFFLIAVWGDMVCIKIKKHYN